MKIKKTILTLTIMIIFVLSLLGCSSNQVVEQINSFAQNNIEETTNIEGNMVVNYIDVGQADSILVEVGSKKLLIDAGTTEAGEKVAKFLDDKNIKKIDYIIATHPHEDHIGGMSYIIDNFDIGKIYSPKVTTTTNTYENMISSLKKKSLKITTLKGGEDPGIDLDGAKIEVFSPNAAKYEDLNNYSPIIKIKYGEKSFLFTGDAEKEIENEVIDKNVDLKSDVLKVGHHGSASSTTQEFLNEVSPSIAVISVGKNNTYKHPGEKTLTRLEKKNIKIYRTDIDGDIILFTDGSKIEKK